MDTPRNQHHTRGSGSRALTSAHADTSAQSDLWSLAQYLASGFTQADLHPVNLSLSAANRSPIAIEGAFFARITASSGSGKETSCRSMVHVSSSVQAMYLSYETLLNLGLLDAAFPTTENSKALCDRKQNLGSIVESPTSATINANRFINNGCSKPQATQDAACMCPQRTAPPSRAKELPFACTPDNNKAMKTWLLERYASSTFNTCPHRALPSLAGPPVEIHVDPTATSKAFHTPATIPLHWQQKVYDDLLRDEALGVIERVPYGEPVTWCHQMVVTCKHDGSARRTVDLSPLNKFCQHETFATESPFHLPRRIPTNAWKTVTDAWNGYHSVPLRASDHPLTTFITPFRRWRYTRAPQGFLSSGDGYNRRFDTILSEFECKEHCVDDTVHYDTDLEQHWWRTIDFLTCVGQSGVVLNPDKFQFAMKSVNFPGFRVSNTTIEPLPKYLDAIRHFPTPTSTTDIRTWFGLVNQVANYAQLRSTMAPFKPFLSPRCKFIWSEELEAAFQTSKTAIIDAFREGVEIFDLRSRFLSSAEQRYAIEAIEGEALAVAWGLEQTRYFTQGCDNLVVVTDHKPLVKIFGDRTVDERSNSRLFCLKKRTLSWRYDIVHRPGKSNQAADATSRHPSTPTPDSSHSLGTPSVVALAKTALMASIRDDATSLCAISWSVLAEETARDASLGHALNLLEHKGTVDSRDPALSSLSPVCKSLHAQEGVLLYDDRVVVPPPIPEAKSPPASPCCPPASPCCPPRHFNNGTACPHHNLLARHVKGHTRRPRRLKPQCPITGSNTSSTITF
eukprot:gene1442-1587_t